MPWSQEISQLVTEVDQLTAAVNVKKTVLENAANTAVVAADVATSAASASATSAGQAAGSAAQALAIYGSTEAQQAAVQAAQTAASLAEGYTLSASSAIQQVSADRALAEAAAANAQSSALTCATWAVLSGLTGATAGTGAEVLDSDAGTHTDPVVGGTVSNAGRYSWSASPAGWRRIGDTGLSGKADRTSVQAPLPPESGYVWAVKDASGRLGAGLTPDAKLVADLDESSTVPAAALDADAAARLLPDSATYEPVLSETGYLWALEDASGRVGVGLKTDGTTYLRLASDVEVPSSVASNLLPSADIVCWGDSMTAGSGASATAYRYPEALAIALGRSVANRGIGGQGSAQIAARQGGLPVAVTVSGNSIPASGAVSVTAISPAILNSGSSSGTLTGTGTLAGVHGTLSKTGNPAVYTFMRTAAGDAVACPAGSVYIPDEAAEFEGHTVIIWAGRNDNRGSSGAAQRAYLAATRDNILSMVDRLTPLCKRVLVLPIFNGRAVATAGGDYEPSGSVAYANIMLANEELARSLGDRFLAGLRDYMVRYAALDLGLTLTADDLSDIAADCIPRQLFYDDLHLNDYRGIANYVARALIARGW